MIGRLLKSNSFESIIASKADGPLGLKVDFNLNFLCWKGSEGECVKFPAVQRGGSTSSSSIPENLNLSLRFLCRLSKSCLPSPGFRGGGVTKV